MKFTIKDGLISTIVTILIIGFDIFLLYLTRDQFNLLPIEFQGIAKIALFVLLFFILMGPVYYKILRLARPIESMVSSINENSSALTVWKQLMYSYEFSVGIVLNIVPEILRAPFFRLFGAALGKRVLIAGKIVEPYLIEMGDDSHIGDASILTGHAIVKDKVILGKIKIGRNVVVGVKAVIMPNVKIGDGSIILPGAVVKPNTNIPSNEEWGGLPARKIKDLGKAKKIKGN